MQLGTITCKKDNVIDCFSFHDTFQGKKTLKFSKINEDKLIIIAIALPFSESTCFKWLCSVLRN